MVAAWSSVSLCVYADWVAVPSSMLQVEIAQAEGAKWLAHGATGKGNDQVCPSGIIERVGGCVHIHMHTANPS